MLLRDFYILDPPFTFQDLMYFWYYCKDPKRKGLKDGMYKIGKGERSQELTPHG